MTIAMFATVAQMPKLLPRLGAKPLLIAGAALMTVTMLWLTQLDADGSYWTTVFGPLLVFGIGMGLSFMPLNVTILAGVEPRDSGSASGILQTVMQLGGALGLAILVTVFGTSTKDVAGQPAGADAQTQAEYAFTHGLDSAFGVGAIFVGIAQLIAILAFQRPRPPAAAAPAVAKAGPAPAVVEPGPAEPGPAEPGPAEPGPAEPGPAAAESATTSDAARP
jgi:MFS family permease